MQNPNTESGASAVATAPPAIQPSADLPKTGPLYPASETDIVGTWTNPLTNEKQAAIQEPEGEHTVRSLKNLKLAELQRAFGGQLDSVSVDQNGIVTYNLRNGQQGRTSI